MARRLVKRPVGQPAGSIGRPGRKPPRKSNAVVGDSVAIPEVIPAELAGKYAVWSPDGLRIVGSGSTLGEALEIADLEEGRLVQRVPKSLRARSLGGIDSTTTEG